MLPLAGRGLGIYHGFHRSPAGVKQKKELVLNQLQSYINERANGMVVIKENYRKAIEEIITINELNKWIIELDNTDIDQIIRDIDIYYKLEMNMED